VQKYKKWFKVRSLRFKVYGFEGDEVDRKERL
jgi:hypothetical protein